MPRRITETEVRHVAGLARLAVSDAEVAQYVRQFEVILEYFDQLNKLDTTDVPPTAHPLPITNVWREDVEKEGCTAEDALANAPQRWESYFQLPKVLDQDAE